MSKVGPQTGSFGSWTAASLKILRRGFRAASLNNTLLAHFSLLNYHWEIHILGWASCMSIKMPLSFHNHSQPVRALTVRQLKNGTWDFQVHDWSNSWLQDERLRNLFQAACCFWLSYFSPGRSLNFILERTVYRYSAFCEVARIFESFSFCIFSSSAFH